MGFKHATRNKVKLETFFSRKVEKEALMPAIPKENREVECQKKTKCRDLLLNAEKRTTMLMSL